MSLSAERWPSCASFLCNGETARLVKCFSGSGIEPGPCGCQAAVLERLHRKLNRSIETAPEMVSFLPSVQRERGSKYLLENQHRRYLRVEEFGFPL